MKLKISEHLCLPVDVVTQTIAVLAKAMSQEAVGRAANLSDRSGSFATYLSKLRGLELVTGRGELRASDELF